MIRFFGYLRLYIASLNISSFLFISLILSVLIYFNYTFSLNNWILGQPSFLIRLTRAAILYVPAFAGICLLDLRLRKQPFPKGYFFYLLLFITPLIFAMKVSVRTGEVFSGLRDQYYLVALQWPLKAFAVIIVIAGIGYLGGYKWPYFGTGVRDLHLRPYYLLVLLMAPFLFIAGASHDFQAVYPKLQTVGGPGTLSWLKIVFFELCYGIDFFTIELFFRGFIVIAFTRYLGKDIILPMAFFYCVIHFGKPLAECISSYFGGMILGTIVYRTHSIWGGLVVHLGIAWLMEVVGFVL